jgi:hypothetical protein
MFASLLFFYSKKYLSGNIRFSIIYLIFFSAHTMASQMVAIRANSENLLLHLCIGYFIISVPSILEAAPDITACHFLEYIRKPTRFYSFIAFY